MLRVQGLWFGDVLGLGFRLRFALGCRVQFRPRLRDSGVLGRQRGWTRLAWITGAWEARLEVM